MSRVRVVTDSACDLPDEIVEALNIAVVSLTIRFGSEEFSNRSDLSPSEFWARCKSAKELPETSAPSVGAFQEVFESAARDGYDGVIVLALSSHLSATYQSATLASEAVAATIPVNVIDTLAVSMAQGLMTIDVAEAANAGASLEELRERATGLIDRVGVVAALDTLEHLIKGGRVGGAKALLGQVLSIKPLVELKGGVVAEAGRQRTRAKALIAIAHRAQEQEPFRRLALMHGACSDADIATLRSLVAPISTEVPIVETNIGPVVGTHGGPGIIGLAWLKA
ncbi:MAG TPA: DegV family protein [Acidimicrobiales bacterium]|nr:DegV family protein [Acidimicrobiales bacterium]